jgi:histidine triad (HIT) family protein
MATETKPDCLFCKIIRKEIPAEIVFEDDSVLAFRDIAPKAPTHILVIPKRHVDRLSDTTRADEPLLGRLVGSLAEVARKLDLDDYRVVLNNGTGAGQVVFHVHVHLMAGRRFQWPAG